MLQKLKQFAATTALVLLGLMPGVAPATDVTVYFHNDPAGNPLVATDAGGNVVWKASYQPYGQEIDQPAAGANNEIWFHGKPYDPATGLSYFGARYYDPIVGRFPGIDPKGFDEANIHSFNRYAYGNNNPYRFVDPDGRDAKEVLSDVWNYNPWIAPVRMAVESAGNGQYGTAALYAGAAALPLVGKSGGGATLAETQSIRFTQDSVGAVFKDGRTVQGLIDGLKSGKVSPADLPPIRTFEKDGLTFTLDNRRLLAASEAKTQVLTVPASAKDLAKELPGKFTTQNQGSNIGVRQALE